MSTAKQRAKWRETARLFRKYEPDAAREWREANRERLRAYNREYQRARRARAKAGLRQALPPGVQP